MIFAIDIYAWIPDPEVPNPIASLPGGTARWGPGACGPHFGGDNFVTPPGSPAGWSSLTYRARQHLDFEPVPWGNPAPAGTHSGVVPGTTTVLTAPRAAGGRVCHSVTAHVSRSSGSVDYSPGDNWYEVRMRGKARDPVPAGVGSHVLGSPGGAVGGLLTPELEWDLLLRIQHGSRLSLLTRTRYRMDCPMPSLDESAGLTGSAGSLGGGTGNLIHGTISVRRFPSYIVYVTLTPTPSGSTSQVVFFGDADTRGLAEIAVPWDSQLRNLTW